MKKSLLLVIVGAMLSNVQLSLGQNLEGTPIAGKVASMGNTRYPQLYRKNDTNTKSNTVFYCIGTEPQWALTLEVDNFSYIEDRMEGKYKLNMPRVKPRIPPGFVSDYAQIFQTHNNKNHAPVTILVRKNDAGCHSGYIEQLYEFNGTIITPDFIRIGCCDALRY